MEKENIIPCKLAPETKALIESYTKSLTSNAAKVGSHGLTEKEFWASGIFRSAIESIRGTQAASMEEKRHFVSLVLDVLKAQKKIKKWHFAGSSERHDYEIIDAKNKVIAIETKGCLDGNNTNIFERPANAEEFYIWSLCQNPGSDPKHNAWSGIHTRLTAEIIHRKNRVDGLIIWDMLCGTKGRPCPKLKRKQEFTLLEDSKVPPPCIYLFPKTIPDPRNNPKPPVWKLSELNFAKSLATCFQADKSDIMEVQIESRINKNSVERKTSLSQAGNLVTSSDWTEIKRAK